MRTGASQGFPRAAAPLGVFSQGTTRTSGSPSCAHTASSWMRVSGFPSLQAKQWVCRGLGQRTKATWTGLWSRSQMPGFQLHDSRWDFPGPQPNLKHGGSVAQSCLTLVTPWTVALQAPLSMGFPRQDYWSGSPCPPPGDLPDPGIKPRSPANSRPLSQ